MKTPILCLSLLLFSAAALAAPIIDKQCALPSYQRNWVDGDVQGDVVLGVKLNADGKVRDAKVISTSGFRELDRASLKAVKECNFSAEPADSQAWTKVRYIWNIK